MMRTTIHPMLRHRSPLWAFAANELNANRGEAQTAPRLGVDAYETDDRYELHIDVPGVAKENVEVEYTDGWLSVKGTRSVDVPEGARVLRSGRRSGDFHTRISVGEDVDVPGITAEVREGVLYVTVPKSDRVKPRQIPITVN